MATTPPKILTPIRKRSMMTGWKSAFDFDQQQPVGRSSSRRKPNGRGSRGVIETTSRLRRRSAVKKGTFQKKAKDHEAPNLLSVVNAKAEIKNKAVGVAKDREKKREQKKKLAGRIVVRKKDAPQLKKDEWTNALNPSKPTNNQQRPKMRGKKSENTAAADWKKAYQDIFSPQSGKPKLVAKQDLISNNKISSPKKKTRSTPKKKKSVPKIPDLPMDSDDDDQVLLQKPPSPVVVEPEEEPEPPRRATKPVLIEPDSPEPPQPMEDEYEEEPQPMEEEAPKPKEAPSYDDFVDFDSEAGSESTPIEQESAQVEAEKEQVSAAAAAAAPAEPLIKGQLVLEFALPSEDGEEDDGKPGLEVPVDLEYMDEISSVGSWPSIESDDSYDTRMHKMMQRWVDVDGAYDEEMEEATVYDNDVDLEDNVLDHIVLAAPDLDEAIVQFEEMTGIRPTPVGPLQGLGAKTAHVGLDENRYVEILAPDDENPGPIGEDLKRLEPGTLTPFHYAIRSSEVTRLIEGYVYDVLGWDPDHIAMVQALPDNSLRQWDLLTMYGHDVGGVAPCYVKWKDHGQHPTASIPLKADLLACTVRAPAGHDVHKLITGVGGINVEYGKPLLECVLATPKGRLAFSADYPAGLVFPGYEDEHIISEMPELLPVSGDQSGDEDWADIGTQSESSF